MQRSALRTSTPTTGQGAPPVLVWSALWSVYIIWGCTYLAIRVADRTLPPFLMAGSRFVVAGGLMYGWAVWRGETRYERPTARQWLGAAVVGGLLCLGGNGLVAWAEQRIDSGLTALIIATVPMWLAIMDRVFFGQRLSWPAVLGLGIGFGGLAILVQAGGGKHTSLVGVLVVVLAAFCWAAGSMYSRRAPLPPRPILATGMQMLTGGALLLIVGLGGGEAGRVHLSHVGLTPALGWGYLVVFGSLVAFTSYLWLLRVAPTSLVGTYAYVNPIIAVLAGWLLLHEAITGRTVVGGAIIVVGVALIVTARPVRTASGEPGAAQPPSHTLDEHEDEGAA